MSIVHCFHTQNVKRLNSHKFSQITRYKIVFVTKKKNRKSKSKEPSCSTICYLKCIGNDLNEPNQLQMTHRCSGEFAPTHRRDYGLKWSILMSEE